MADKILVIGDSCTDIFIYGDIERICPEAPVPVFIPTHTTKNPGMAKNVVMNFNTLGIDVDIITNNNEIKKTRYVDNRSNQIVLRVDDHDYCSRIKKAELEKVKNYDIVVISDYCKGFLNEDDIDNICSNSRIIFLDTKKRLNGWSLSADFIKINELEYKKNYEFLERGIGYEDKLIITRGRKGCEYMGEEFPVKEVHVKDVSGAGDTFMTGLVYEYMNSKDIRKAINFAQKCSINVVQKHGVAAVLAKEVIGNFKS